VAASFTITPAARENLSRGHLCLRNIPQRRKASVQCWPYAKYSLKLGRRKITKLQRNEAANSTSPAYLIPRLSRLSFPVNHACPWQPQGGVQTGSIRGGDKSCELHREESAFTAVHRNMPVRGILSWQVLLVLQASQEKVTSGANQLQARRFLVPIQSRSTSPWTMFLFKVFRPLGNESYSP